jgi:hypothetical protein
MQVQEFNVLELTNASIKMKYKRKVRLYFLSSDITLQLVFAKLSDLFYVFIS